VLQNVKRMDLVIAEVRGFVHKALSDLARGGDKVKAVRWIMAKIPDSDYQSEYSSFLQGPVWPLLGHEIMQTPVLYNISKRKERMAVRGLVDTALFDLA
jgi:hypothetical protein